MYINLLPADFVLQQTLRRQLRAWAAVLAVLLVCGAAHYARNLADVWLLESQVAEHTAKHPGLRPMNSENAQWEHELAQAQVEKDLVERLRSDKRAVTLVGIAARSIDQAAGESRLQHLSVHLPSPYDAAFAVGAGQATSATPAATGEPGKGSLVLDGVAADADTISHLVTLLRQSGPLAEVSLKGSSETSTGSEHDRQFRIECSFGGANGPP